MDEQCDVACEPAAGAAMIGRQNPVLATRLKEEEKSLEAKLEDVKRAQVLLAENPAIEEILNILGRSGRRLL